MGIEKITERQVIGWFYEALSQYTGASWIDSVSNYFTSDQAKEEYAWLGMVPALREWVAGRNAKSLSEYSFEIKNVHFEATLELLVRDLRRDKTGQVRVRISELARRAVSHYGSLLSTLILNGATTTCYDGQYFFDTDHSEGSSGTQSNSISIDISALPTTVHGSTTIPSVEELQLCIMQSIGSIVGFKDDQGEPCNDDSRSFLVMVPLTYLQPALQAVATPMQVAASQTAMSEMIKRFTIQVEANPRLSTWTANFATFRTDSAVKALVRQEETGVKLAVKGEGSEYEFDNDAHQYGIDTWRNVGYGDWKKACLVTLT